MIENVLSEVGWKNMDRLDAGWLVLTIEEISAEKMSAGKVNGNVYHQELADIAANWLASLGLTWKLEQWHAGYRCDLIANDMVIEVGNTDPDRAMEHLYRGTDKFCVIPYQEGAPITVLIFQRGPAWNDVVIGELLVQPDLSSKRMAERLGL